MKLETRNWTITPRDIALFGTRRIVSTRNSVFEVGCVSPSAILRAGSPRFDRLKENIIRNTFSCLTEVPTGKIYFSDSELKCLPVVTHHGDEFNPTLIHPNSKEIKAPAFEGPSVAEKSKCLELAHLIYPECKPEMIRDYIKTEASFPFFLSLRPRAESGLLGFTLEITKELRLTVAHYYPGGQIIAPPGKDLKHGFRFMAFRFYLEENISRILTDFNIFFQPKSHIGQDGLYKWPKKIRFYEKLDQDGTTSLTA